MGIGCVALKDAGIDPYETSEERIVAACGLVPIALVIILDCDV
jgi:hypothetical protein